MYVYVSMYHILRAMSNKRPRTEGESSNKQSAKKSKLGGHWSLGLLNSLEDPQSIIFSDDLVTVIKDKYPKAEYHYLVIPKENISNLKAVKNEHLSLLQHMQEVGNKLTRDAKHNTKKFKFGYHSQASMFRLHMHVISDDMNSECLKTKKHWNSFNTKFFLESQAVCEDLRKNGKVWLPSSEQCKHLLNLPLQCHKCGYTTKTMPDLKKHILIHL